MDILRLQVIENGQTFLRNRKISVNADQRLRSGGRQLCKGVWLTGALRSQLP